MFFNWIGILELTIDNAKEEREREKGWRRLSAAKHVEIAQFIQIWQTMDLSVRSKWHKQFNHQEQTFHRIEICRCDASGWECPCAIQWRSASRANRILFTLIACLAFSLLVDVQQAETNRFPMFLFLPDWCSFTFHTSSSSTMTTAHQCLFLLSPIAHSPSVVIEPEQIRGAGYNNHWFNSLITHTLSKRTTNRSDLNMRNAMNNGRRFLFLAEKERTEEMLICWTIRWTRSTKWRMISSHWRFANVFFIRW